MRTQFTFYASFWEAIRRIKDPAARAEAYDVICEYALTGAEPEVDFLTDAAATAYIMAKPNLDASKRKAEAGKRGGSGKQTEANGKQAQAEPKQGGAASKPKQAGSEKENKKESEREIENECYTPPTPSISDFGFSPDLEAAVNDWLAYKREQFGAKRGTYQPKGLKSLLTQIKNAAAEYGDAAVIGVIRESMSSLYMGIVFDRLKKGGNAGGAGRNTCESPKPKRDWGIAYDV